MLSLYLTACLLLGSAVGRTIVDLTHTLDKDAPPWPLERLGIYNLTHYKLETLYFDCSPSGMCNDLRRVEFYEHSGTHMDAPSHFARGRQAMHEVPPDRLVGPGVMIDVTDKAEDDINYAVSVGDIHKYETKYGQIPAGAIVLINSGWAQRYPIPPWVFGTDTPDNSTTFNYPGYSLDACKMLLQDRQVSIVGVDTPSVDPGTSTGFPCHVLLQTNNVPLLEYVANLDAMPPAGSTVFVGSMKHRDGSGGPTRLLAVVEDDGDDDMRVGSGAELFGANAVTVFGVLLLLSLIYR